MKSSAAKVWWGFLTFVMALAVWLSASGTVVLQGFPLPMMESLAQARGLVTSSVPIWGEAVLGRLPGDEIVWMAALTVLANLLGAAALYSAGLWTWRNPLSPTLAVGVAFFAQKTLWLKTASPTDSLTHLLLALALAAILAGTVPLFALFIIALALLSPAQAVMFMPVLAYLAFRRQAAYGLVIPAVSLLGVGGLLIPLAGEYRLVPGLTGWSVLTLAPLLLSVLTGPVRQARAGIYLTLLLGSVLTGVAELASVLALGDLAFVILEKLNRAEPPTSVRGFRLRADRVVIALATLAFVAVVLPGEQHLNRRVLIPAQKADVPFGELWRFFSLDRHARRAAQDPWRANTPFAEMTARDFELALELPAEASDRGFCPLTFDGKAESRRVALLYALISGKPLRGWDSPRHLAGPLLLSKLRGRNLLNDGPVIVSRDAKGSKLAEPAAALVGTPAELDLRRIMIVPYRSQAVSTKKGGGYRWISPGGEFQVVFADTPVEVLLSAEPCEIRVVSAHPSQAKRQLEVPRFHATLSELPQESLPSRSLVPLRVRLKNDGEVAFGSEMLERWRLDVVGQDPAQSFVQLPSKPFLLFPGESTVVELQLATPEAEGVFWLDAKVLTPDDRQLEVAIEKGSPLRTWRRTPAVGTWVEEP